MTQVVINQAPGGNCIESKSAGESNCFTGGGTLNTGTTSTYSYAPSGYRYLVAGNPWRAYIFYGRIPLADIPEGAIITNVAMQYYVRTDDTTQNHTSELYHFNWYALFASATDWQTPTELQALHAGNQLLGSRSTAGGTGWKGLTMNQTNAKTELQTAVDNGDSYFEYIIAGSGHRTDITMTTSTLSVLDIDDVSNEPFWTIDFVVPGLAAIMNGCIA